MSTITNVFQAYSKEVIDAYLYESNGSWGTIASSRYTDFNGDDDGDYLTGSRAFLGCVFDGITGDIPVYWDAFNVVWW